MPKLPNAEAAFIDPRKVSYYLLAPSHPVGRTKAAYFMRFGFSTGQPQVLELAPLDHAPRWTKPCHSFGMDC